MTSRDFCYWLQGWFELNKTIDHREGATKETLYMIQNHLALVFKYEIDPSIPDPTGELQVIHDGPPKPVLAPNTIEGPQGILYRC